MTVYWADLSDEDLRRELARGYLEESGWNASIQQRRIIDNSGPVPWYTYPAQAFLAGVAKSDWRVFEYGAGASSTWWARRVSFVAGVDHDPEWVSANKDIATVTAHVRAPEAAAADIEAYVSMGLEPVLTDEERRKDHLEGRWRDYTGYAGTIARYPRHSFDVVVVDGLARPLCAWMAARWVKPDGLIVFDNSDRETYRPGYELLAREGWKAIPFHGMGPLNPYAWCTSVYLRSLDSL